MTEWIEYDGTNPPMDTTKHLIVQWESGDTTLANPPWIPVNGRPDRMVAYVYLDPYEPPLPPCWCGAEAKTVEHIGFYEICCSRDLDHQRANGSTRAVAELNWRNGRKK